MNTNFDLTDPEKSVEDARKAALLLSVGRLGLFFLLGFVLIVGISESHWSALLFLPLSGLFVVLILRFNTQKDREHFYESLLEIQRMGEKRKERKLSGFDPGADFIDPNHPFSSDLDLFGEHSLFQLLNHTVSNGGRSKLAQWIRHPLPPKAAEEKREALLELSSKVDFLLIFESLGKAFLKQEKSKTTFYRWLEKPIRWSPLFLLPMIIGPSFGLGILLGVLFGWFPTVYLSIFIAVGLLLLGLVFKPLLAAMKALPNDSDLKTLQAWANLLERQEFEHPLLKGFQQPVKNHGFLASMALDQLESLTFLLQNRTNLMYLIFNVFFWTDFFVLYRLVRWQNRVGSYIREWEETFENWEALISLAAFIREEKISAPVHWSSVEELHMVAVKHPLIKPVDCVPNDFKLEEKDQVILLTGSNMSGKTTFMRTVGINLVLAGMGVPPFAAQLRSGHFQLYTSMRNTDSLGESISSFYAELARIKGLLDLAKGGKPIFYLLDEILKGTNTADRIMGSEALIRQLAGSSSKGIISTHDIELSEMESSLPSLINYSFHHDIQKEEIVFDYKIKKGPCPNFNAQKLMGLMGINLSKTSSDKG
ncbi:MutS-related protein [Cyclobacterium jeungdonense]|uniref:DNA mismatch repair protein n=1 Tax=Cyclobacterium jeungdonense TaxID=708087 RepID=A0ABT8C9V7_9BACT|nr:DNA mismatch repair protein [Cyclobacterium jeungdonense]MDN3689588.1 DNA mismatch repair protein [Cyclobacterium jeungdonense]